jgi:hypothetical protein
MKLVFPSAPTNHTPTIERQNMIEHHTIRQWASAALLEADESAPSFCSMVFR